MRNFYFRKLIELMPEKQRKEQMEKLYSAIGYSENEVITPFPKEVIYDVKMLLIVFFLFLYYVTICKHRPFALRSNSMRLLGYTTMQE